jgi:hypothetical protein
MKKTIWAAVLMACVGGGRVASAQIVESVGARALGMGGAFVGVATDSTATWWNPAALATGPFLDLSLGRQLTETAGELPLQRDRAFWVAMATPPLGASYAQFRVTGTPTAQPRAHREEEGAAVSLRSLSASQFGVTLVHSVVSGVHVGTTLKYVRATPRLSIADATRSSSDLLDTGDDLSGGDPQNAFDLDVGVLAVTGALRVGAVVRNVREPEFDVAGGAAPTDVDAGGSTLRIPRQVRAGLAFDAESTAASVPLIVSLDADLRRYTAGAGERRVVAVGAERWFLERRLGVRGGGRFNTVGRQERAATGGVSVAIRSGLFVEAHAVRGGSDDERGWGVAARVSF